MSTTTPDLVEVPTRSKPLVALITVLLAINSLLMFYVIIKIWPSNGSVAEHFFLFGKQFTLTPERRYMLMMPLGGALGASIHLIISFTAFVGNRAFVITWIPWYALRPFVGAGLALFFYLLLRGGILTYSPAPETPATDSGQVSAPAPARSPLAAPPPGDSVAYAAYVADSLRAGTAQKDGAKAREKSSSSPAIPLNPYGMMAIACMVGMFSKEAARKLEETFKTVFNVKAEDKIEYADKLPTDPDHSVSEDTDGDPASKTDADINDVLTDADTDTKTDTDTTPQG